MSNLFHPNNPGCLCLAHIPLNPESGGQKVLYLQILILLGNEELYTKGNLIMVGSLNINQQ